MGVGTPEDLVAGVGGGHRHVRLREPTRNARNGWLFTRYGDIKIRNATHRNSLRPPRRTLRVLYLPPISRVAICIICTAPAKFSARS